ncbi:MAG: alpha amylase N-terminal ig-like domain-containing protein [Lachnospiraceae bacterium]|nr:alpha amylase N-terminal ig-like domain-containing protein [Lachnospiraceae bacterium]
MEYSAITHYMEKRYCYAIEKGKFLIRIETKKDDMKRVTLHCRDKYIPIEFLDTWASYEMNKVASSRFHDYYEVVIDIDCICLRYFFELEDKYGEVTYYGNYDFYEEKIDNIDRMFDLPQNLREEEIHRVPQWAKNKVVYQIFPSRYATTEKVSEKDWYKAPIGPRDDLKGNLRGVINALVHLKDMGIDVLYMTPIFKSNSSHKYDTIDYYKIDDSFGGEDDLKELVNKAHSMDMKVILDGVFNHTSPEFFAFKDIVENKANSRYKDWYYIDSFPVKQPSRMTRPNFKTFAYFGGMPKLNLNNEETAQYFINVGKYWIEKCNIDGWRLDVGDEVVHEFWKKFRKAVKSVKEDAFVIGEIWHYAGDFLEGDEWDSIMNYSFYYSVHDFLCHETISASRFVESLDFMRGRLYRDINAVLLNLIDSHDTARFLHVASGDKKKLKLAAAFQLLLPGMPMIYYGDEYGMTGGNDPDCRRGMVWDEKYQDLDIYNWYCNLIRTRKENPALTEGELVSCMTDDDKGIIKMVRRLDDKEVIVIFNGRGASVSVDKYVGRIDEITGEVFDGELAPYRALVLK